MTRAEQLAAKIQRAKDALEKQRLDVVQDEARLRELTRKENDKRRYEVGTLAEEAGLFPWTNAELAAAFTALMRARERETMRAVSDAILGDPQPYYETANGVAESATRVSAAH